MAALPDRSAVHRAPAPRVVDLRSVDARSLASLLAEEVAAWRADLDWDFSTSADLVRRFVGMQALSGFALFRGSEAIGYSYYVCEEGKGLIGDLYIARAHANTANENALLEAVLASMWRTPGVRRVEAQLMMLGDPLTRGVPDESRCRRYPRFFLEAPLVGVAQLACRELTGVAISPWLESRQEDTARLIAVSYRGHIDSQINDQYRSPGGARRFLTNIVQYPGCGAFFAPASLAATDRSTRVLCGVSLASQVGPDIGHITQVSVAPEHRNTGLGYELMRRSLVALQAHGCRSASLTVTASNDPAIRLYERMGFINRRTFAAYVWEAR